MATKNVDIVFLMDASESMAPCFRQVCDNINTLLEQPQLKSFNIHLGLLAHCMPNYNTYRFQAQKIRAESGGGKFATRGIGLLTGKFQQRSPEGHHLFAGLSGTPANRSHPA